ncbi:hypothetical protein HD806DRAFT_290925 [Xylariaceae sp. AK1471]|nr:hypothetical protein HD806DRAFT_290925 [Xylariaceae sp. AK1471]
MSKDLITEFVENYDRQVDFYTEVARLAEERCRKALSENGIPAIITSRAKRPERLLEKLKQRNVEKKYKSADDILKDLVDLSGVRVALYFPSQAAQTAQLLKNSFFQAEIKTIPPPVAGPPAHAPQQTQSVALDESYKNQFVGYRAIHIRASLGTASLPTEKHRYGSSMVEIQIASLLMHAWSEVNHDLVYKTFSGKLSDDELRALDTINGLMLTGEVVLGQLKFMVENRVAMQKKPFATYFELGAFVQTYAPYQTVASGPKYRMGSLSWLLYVTKHLGIDNPSAFGEQLQKWKADGSTEYPVVRSILDYLFNTVHKQRKSDPMTTPYLLAQCNGLFKDMSEKDKTANVCRILGYARDESALAEGPGLGIDNINFPDSFQLLWDKDLLRIGDSLPVVPGAEGEYDEVVEAVKDLWQWFATNESAQVRVALGIGRARQGNKVPKA